MPTVHAFDGYRVFIPTNDHRPAHVHVAKAGNEAVFFLSCPDGPVALRENYGFKRAEIGAIERELGSDRGGALRPMGEHSWPALKQ